MANDAMYRKIASVEANGARELIKETVQLLGDWRSTVLCTADDYEEAALILETAVSQLRHAAETARRHAEPVIEEAAEVT